VQQYRKRSTFSQLAILIGIASIWALPGYANTVPDVYSGSPDAAATLPPVELSGWFFDSSSPVLFPDQPDLSQPWTSAENIALMNSWLNLVQQADGDPNALAQLVGLGADGPSTVSQTSVSSSQQVSTAPEPALLGLLGSGVALLALYMASRIRQNSLIPSDRGRSRIIERACLVTKA
jgi:hypothetical protein